MHDAVVAGAERLQLRPTIDLALNESDGLNRLQHASIVEISEAAIPTPTAARKTKLLARLHVRGEAVFHVLKVAGALPEEMTLGQPKFGGDVAHINIEQ